MYRTHRCSVHVASYVSIYGYGTAGCKYESLTTILDQWSTQGRPIKKIEIKVEQYVVDTVCNLVSPSFDLSEQKNCEKQKWFMVYSGIIDVNLTGLLK